MPVTHKKRVQYFNGSEQLTDTLDTVSGDGEAVFDDSIAATVEKEVDLAFPFAKVKSVVMSSTKAATVRTNANHLGSPDDTIVIPAGGQVTWTENEAADCPFTVDVTKLYITNDHATLAAAVKVYVLLNVTP